MSTTNGIGSTWTDSLSAYRKTKTASKTSKSTSSSAAETTSASTSQNTKVTKTNYAYAPAVDESTDKSGTVSGRTIGNPKISTKAAEVYKKLQEKYGNVEFVLVSESAKGAVNANAGAYGNSSKTVVLINEEKLERMAEDENYAAQIEAKIEAGTSQLAKFAQQLSASGTSVNSFGMSISDNGASSFFADVDAANEQSQKLAEKRAEKKAAEKKAAKKAAKKEAEEKIAEKRAEKREETEALREKWAESPDAFGDYDNSTESLRITGTSMEAVVSKLTSMAYEQSFVMTEAESVLGGTIDFKG